MKRHRFNVPTKSFSFQSPGVGLSEAIGDCCITSYHSKLHPVNFGRYKAEIYSPSPINEAAWGETWEYGPGVQFAASFCVRRQHYSRRPFRPNSLPIIATRATIKHLIELQPIEVPCLAAWDSKASVPLRPVRNGCGQPTFMSWRSGTQTVFFSTSHSSP